MAKKAKRPAFDPKVFLATGNGARTISNYKKDKIIFSQGKPADAVFYIQKGKVKVTVISEQGKEAIVAVMGPDEFCGPYVRSTMKCRWSNVIRHWQY